MLEQSRKTKKEVRPISELSDKERDILYYFLESNGGKDLLNSGYDESLPINLRRDELGYLIDISLRNPNAEEINYYSCIAMVSLDVAFVKTTKKQSNHKPQNFVDFVHPYSIFERKNKSKNKV